MALSSLRAYTAPVGLLGEQRMTPAVRSVALASRSSTLTFRLHCGSPSTITGVARQSRTICGYDTQAGVGINTLSCGPNSVKQALNTACLAPVDTTMLSALTGLPAESSDSDLAAAARRSSSPAFGGYLVLPS